MVIYLIIALILAVLAALSARRFADFRADRQATEALILSQPAAPARFDPVMVAPLPEPARRFFLYTIAPGTPLYTVATLTMEGKFGMGDRAKPDYMAMSARQTLAAPTGFIWRMHARRGSMRISGSDTGQWTRFWLMGLLPVARMGGDADHTLSAFGRYIAEAVFWTPAVVLPGPNVHWELVDVHTARVTVRHGGLSQAVDVTVAGDGRPIQVRFDRWSNANPEKEHRWQPFGGYLSEFRDVDGFRLPTHVEAGNYFGTERYFPFFVVDVTEIVFPHD
ncbi:hypothetical protein MD273_15930 [Marinobacter pelagius]|uniref:DUF6544 family protein n=1 Tax=Marinobacter sp. C7 TaxID=2951363 RepID=UPI001EEF7AC0|nr:DUF6544 family protein [Marinobacter sp. C7]MCG7201224.1 hypothetical protein [Marinobacter sp. C7]